MSYADKIRHALSAYEPRELGERLGAVGAEADARLEVAQRMAEALKVARSAQAAITPTRGNRAIHLRAELAETDAALAEWENTK